MGNVLKLIITIIITISIIGCSGGKTTQNELGGLAQKGIFLKGSKAKIYKLKSDYTRDLSLVKETTIGEGGRYNFGKIGWSGISEIEVSGKFINENTGDKNQSAILTSIVDVKANGHVNTNVNVLTHMSSGKIKELLKKGASLHEAKRTITHELIDILSDTGLNINDFGDLDISDLTGQKATANSELLFLSAALLKSNNFKSDLKEILELYKKGGIETILHSEIYHRLMDDKSSLDKNKIINNVANLTNAQKEKIKLPSTAKITKLVNNNTVTLELYGAKFTTKTPQFDVAVEGGNITINNISVSDDNKSATFDISGDTGSCQDVNLSLDINDTYTNYDAKLETNTLNMHSPTTVCHEASQGGSLIPNPADNLAPVAVIGMSLDGVVDGQQAAQVINTQVGVTVVGLETEYSYDQDPFPQGGIVHCEWKDENNNIIKENNNASCNIYDKVFTTAGDYVYTLTVKDNQDATNSNHVTIHVIPNNAPTTTLSPNTKQTINVGDSLEINATATDADGDSMTYLWMYGIKDRSSQTSAGIGLNFNQTFNTAGDYVVEFSATDSHGATTRKSVEVTVVAVVTDQPPVPTIDGNTSMVNKTIYAGNAPYALAEATDDHGIVYCKWSDATGATLKEATFSAEQSMDYNHCQYFFPEIQTAGEYLYTFTVRDTVGQIRSNELNVTVLANAAPIIGIGNNRQIEAGQTLNITATATDADGDSMTYLWMYGIKDSGSQTGAGATTSFSHIFSNIGIYTVTFEATDIHGATSTASIDVNVTAANNPPTADAGQDQNVSTNSTVSLDGSSSSDADGDTITYSWTMTSKPAGSSATLDNNTSDKPTFTADKEGDYLFSLVVNDTKANSTEATVKITAISGYSGAAAPGDFVRFFVTGSGADTNLNYQIDGSVFNHASGTIPLQQAISGKPFYFGDIGGGQSVKIGLANNLGIAIVPTDNEGNKTLVVGLALTEDVNETKLTGGSYKNYIYADISNNGDVLGSILTVAANHKFMQTDIDNNQAYGCWISLGDHILGKLDPNASSLDNVDCDNLSDLNDTTADVRVVIKPGSSRSGIIVDNVDGSGFGIGLEQKRLVASEITGIYQMFAQESNGSTSLYQVEVGPNGSGGFSYQSTPYNCNTSGCTLDSGNPETGSIAINTLCDGTDLNGTICVNGTDLGFIDPVDGYFLVAGEDITLFGIKSGDNSSGGGTNHDLSQIVVVGDKMWENTNEALPILTTNGELMNGKTYDQAVAYCENLELGGFDDWRIPHASWDDSLGYNRSNNELLSIRRQPLDKNDGTVWHYVDNNSYADINDSSPTIIEPFAGPLTQEMAGAYWTDDNISDNAHVAMIFNYEIESGDAFSNDQNLSVRCVRDIQSGDAPLVVDAGDDGTFTNSGEGGAAHFPLSVNEEHGTATEYQWKYGNDIKSTSKTFDYTPDHDGTNVLVLKAVDANGNIAWDVVHFHKGN